MIFSFFQFLVDCIAIAIFGWSFLGNKELMECLNAVTVLTMLFNASLIFNF